MGPRWVRVALFVLASFVMGGLLAYDILPENLRCRDVLHAARILLGGLYDWGTKATDGEKIQSPPLEC